VNNQDKTKGELIAELEELQQAHNFLKVSFNKGLDEKKEDNRMLEKLINVSKDFIQFSDSTSYDKILQIILDLSGASYAALNLFDDNGLEFTTVALAGINENIKKAASFLGFDVVHKHWKQDVVREEKIKENTITRFEHLYELTGHVISKKIIQSVEKVFGIQETFVVKTEKNKQALGDFTLIFKKGETLKNRSFVEMYAQQVGLFLDRNKTIYARMESEEKYRQLIENSHDIIYTVTTEGVFTFVSPAWTELLGHQTTEVVGKSFREFVHPDDLDNCFGFLQKAITTGQRQERLEYRFRDTNGTWRWHSSNVVPLRDKNGKITGFEGIAKDITERRQAEEKLRESEEQLKTLINSTPDIICFKDGQGRWLIANDADLELFCLKNVNYVGKTDAELAEFTDPIYKQAFLSCMESDEKAWRAKAITTNEEAITNPDGTTKIFDVIKVPVFEPGGVRKGLVVIGRDITERKKVSEELIIAKEHAEESDRLKSAFLANMSHEIRTPMNGILGFAELLKEPELTEDQQQEYISMIEKSGARMLNIINNIIDISKIEAGLMKRDIKETNINEQIEYIYTFFKPEVEAKGMNLSFKNGLPAKGAIIKTDREKLFSILTNLVKNAIKYSEKGSIELGYEPVVEANPATSLPHQTFLRFYVKDTGIGIPKDRQDAVFERFIQADIANKMAKQGAGLGLSITKAYVEMLGGQIRVESEEGVGSTFYFTLPYHAETNQMQAKSPDLLTNVEKNQVKNLKVLIVEDDDLSAKLISILIRKFSNEMMRVVSGTDAVESCRNHPDTDLILMDIQLPEMSGYEAAQKIREFNTQVVIIAQTAFGLSGDREKAIEAGCNDYISKPINKDEFQALILKYFGS
jgi:hypothetical protein